MQRLAFLILFFVFMFAGQSLAAEKALTLTGSEKAKKLAAIIMGGEGNLPNRHKAEKYPDLKKFAMKASSDSWWIIYEGKKHAVAASYLVKSSDQPENTELVKGEKP